MSSIGTASPHSSDYEFCDDPALDSTPKTYSTLTPVQLFPRPRRLQDDQLLADLKNENARIKEENKKLRQELLQKEAEMQAMSLRLQAQSTELTQAKGKPKKPKTPAGFRKVLHEAYTTLVKSDETAAFDLSISWPKQKKKVKRLRREINSLCGDGTWSKEVMTDATKTYFTSLKEDKCRQSTESFAKHRNRNRRRNRMNRKLANRKTGSLHLLPEEKEKADQILSLDYTSSDDDTESNVRDVRILAWESEELAALKTRMETLYFEHATPAQKKGHCHKARKVRKDIISDRPVVADAPSWTVKE